MLLYSSSEINDTAAPVSTSIAKMFLFTFTNTQTGWGVSFVILNNAISTDESVSFSSWKVLTYFVFPNFDEDLDVSLKRLLGFLSYDKLT